MKEMEIVQWAVTAIFLTIDQAGGLELFGLEVSEPFSLSALSLCVFVQTHWFVLYMYSCPMCRPKTLTEEEWDESRAWKEKNTKRLEKKWACGQMGV